MESSPLPGVLGNCAVAIYVIIGQHGFRCNIPFTVKIVIGYGQAATVLEVGCRRRSYNLFLHSQGRLCAVVPYIVLRTHGNHCCHRAQYRHDHDQLDVGETTLSVVR